MGLSVDITRYSAAAASRGRGGLLAKRSPAQVAEFLEDGDSRTPEEATARGVSEGVLAHDAHNSYHYADAGRLYELEMLLNAFAIASRRQP